MFLKISMCRQKLIQLGTFRFGCFKIPLRDTSVETAAFLTSPSYSLRINRSCAINPATYRKHLLVKKQIITKGQPLDVHSIRSSLQKRGLYDEDLFPYQILSLVELVTLTKESVLKLIQALDSTQFDIPELSILMRIYHYHGLENLVLSTYDRMCEISCGALTFDVDTLRDMIVALSSTSEWRRCFRLLDLSLIIKPMTFKCFMHVLAAAAREGDFLTFCDLLIKLDKARSVWNKHSFLLIHIETNVVQSYFSSVEKGVEHFTVENLFYLMRKYQFFFEEMVIPSMITQLERSGYLVQTADEQYHDMKFDPDSCLRYQRPRCDICNSHLNRQELTIEEFEELKKAYFALKNVDVYIKNKTTDMEQLKDLIATEGPFDLVIDHLNICLMYPKNGCENSVSICQKLSSRGLKCLVVTREGFYRTRYPYVMKKELGKYASIFISGKNSADDLTMLDATFHCGFNAMVLSNDKFSDHSIKFTPQMRLAFMRWQSCRQITKSFDCRLIFPESPDMLIQESKNGWHIPYGPIVHFLFHQKWLCVKRKDL